MSDQKWRVCHEGRGTSKITQIICTDIVDICAWDKIRNVHIISCLWDTQISNFRNQTLMIWWSNELVIRRLRQGQSPRGPCACTWWGQSRPRGCTQWIAQSAMPSRRHPRSSWGRACRVLGHPRTCMWTCLVSATIVPCGWSGADSKHVLPSYRWIAVSSVADATLNP